MSTEFKKIKAANSVSEGASTGEEVAEAFNDNFDLTDSKLGEKYIKPPSGIPKTDLETDVQTSLDNADNIPTKTSDLTNDSYFVSDSTYVKTDNNFSTALKTKLESLESPKYKGSFVSLSALQTAYPTATVGDTADVTVSDVINQFAWDGTAWVNQGVIGSDTPEMVKQKYESNPDSNAFTDSEKSKLGGIAAGAQKNVKPDWNAAAGNAAEILNKPNLTPEGDYLPLSGGTMTGEISHNVPSEPLVKGEVIKAVDGAYSRSVLNIYKGNGADGLGVGIDGGGTTVIGGGEASTAVFTNLETIYGTGATAASERMVVASDTSIDFISGCQTIANRKTMTLAADGTLTVPKIIVSEVADNSTNTNNLVFIGAASSTIFKSKHNIGTNQLPIYLNAGIPTALTQANLRIGVFGTAAIGSATRPAYIAANGVATQGTHTFPAATSTANKVMVSTSTSGTNAYTASAIGSTTQPIHLNSSGVITACTSGTASAASSIAVRDSSQRIYASGGFFQSSDEKLKDVIGSLNSSSITSKIKKLRKVYYVLKDNPDELKIGTIAQDLKADFPELVSEAEDGILSVDYPKLSVLALSAIDNLDDRLSALESKINQLIQ